jgi:hypothetical protein
MNCRICGQPAEAGTAGTVADVRGYGASCHLAGVDHAACVGVQDDSTRYAVASARATAKQEAYAAGCAAAWRLRHGPWTAAELATAANSIELLRLAIGMRPSHP